MNLKERTFSSLEEVMEKTLEEASNFFESRVVDFEKLVLPKMVKVDVVDKTDRTERKVSLYRDVMMRDEYEIEDMKVVREVGVIVTSEMELAKLENIYIVKNQKESEVSYLSEIELGDLPMLALFIGSLEIDLER